VERLVAGCSDDFEFARKLQFVGNNDGWSPIFSDPVDLMFGDDLPDFGLRMLFVVFIALSNGIVVAKDAEILPIFR